MSIELLTNPAHIIGPTWQRYTNGDFNLPEPNRTIGDQVVEWMYRNILSPADSGPFLPTDEQFRFLLWWYAIDDQGRWTYRKGTLRRMKGWGKDPLSAAMALAELCGPVRFSHFNSEGMPVAERHPIPWIQVVGVSQDQTKNTFALFPKMISKDMKLKYNLDPGKVLIYCRENGGTIEAITSSPYAMEGRRPTLVLKNEVQWWLAANQGHDMNSVISGNVTKVSGSRQLSICNGFIPGMDSIGEHEWNDYQRQASGQGIATGLLYDSIETPPETPLMEIPHPEDDREGYELGFKQLVSGIKIAAGDAFWVPCDTIAMEMLSHSKRSDIIEDRRKYFNQINAAEDSWISPDEWNSVQRDTVLNAGDSITLGFDGSKSSDMTALVACRVEDGTLFVIKVWNPKRTSGVVPRDDVDRVVKNTFARYNVLSFRADVKEFESYVDQWSVAYGSKLRVKASPGEPIAFDMRSNRKQFSLDCEHFLDAVMSKEVGHDGNVTLKQHVLNAKRDYNPTYDAVRIRKVSRDSSNKIDAAVASVLAYAARSTYLGSNKQGSKMDVYA